MVLGRSEGVALGHGESSLDLGHLFAAGRRDDRGILATLGRQGMMALSCVHKALAAHLVTRDGNDDACGDAHQMNGHHRRDDRGVLSGAHRFGEGG